MSISLATITNVNHELTEFALRKSCEAHKFDDVILISDKEYSANNIGNSYRWLQWNGGPDKLPLDLDTYATACIKILDSIVKTEHVLIIQYDGMAIRKEMWSDEFLEYDYIGPPTHTQYSPIEEVYSNYDIDFFKDIEQNPRWFVGGGGFSLRSKKLLTALQDERILPFFSAVNKQTKVERKLVSEDFTICLQYRDILEQDYGIKFAPIDVGLKFGAEVLTGYNQCFGFHGIQNIPYFLSEEECIYFINNVKKRSFNPESEMVRVLAGTFLSVGYIEAFGFLSDMMKKNILQIEEENEHKKEIETN